MDPLHLPEGPLEALLQAVEGPGDRGAALCDVWTAVHRRVLTAGEGAWDALHTALDERYVGPAHAHFRETWARVCAAPTNRFLLEEEYRRHAETWL